MSLVQYKGKNSDDGPSASIWGNCPWQEILLDPNKGYAYWDDFMNIGSIVAGTTIGGHYVYSTDTSNHTVKALATEVGGVLRMGIDASAGDNEDLYLTHQANVGVWGKITDTAPTKKLWWEARVRWGQITEHASFVGLTEEGCGADSFLPDAGTGPVSKDMVGFRILQATPTAIDLVHCAGAATVAAETGMQTIVASTWYKLGIYFDGTKTYWLIDGTKVGGATIAITGVLPAATYFPDGEELVGTFALKTHEASVAKTLDIDWERFAQER